MGPHSMFQTFANLICHQPQTETLPLVKPDRRRSVLHLLSSEYPRVCRSFDPSFLAPKRKFWLRHRERCRTPKKGSVVPPEYSPQRRTFWILRSSCEHWAFVFLNEKNMSNHERPIGHLATITISRLVHLIQWRE